MTQKEIIDTVLNTKWESNNDNSAYEASEVVPFWNDDVAFLVSGIRTRDIPRVYFSTIIQVRPKMCFTTLNKIKVNWEDNDIRTMPRDELLADVGLYREFLGDFLAFHTEEQRKLFLSENEQLVKDYLMID